MLSRNKINIKAEPIKEAKKLFIFCEGDREVNYFKFFKDLSSNIDIIPIPNELGKSDPEKLYNNAFLLIIGSKNEKPKFTFNIDSGDEVWFVIDTDEWNNGDKINILKSNCSKQNKWFVTQSNPCFEIWLYFHFHPENPKIAEIENCTSFKEFVNNKIPGGFNPKKHPQVFQTAIKHSENNFESENGQPKYLSTEVYVLARSIQPFVKEVIDKILATQGL